MIGRERPRGLLLCCTYPIAASAHATQPTRVWCHIATGVCTHAPVNEPQPLERDDREGKGGPLAQDHNRHRPDEDVDGNIGDGVDSLRDLGGDTLVSIM